MAIRVLICDDDKLIRESLKILLPMKKSNIEIVEEGENGREAVEKCLQGGIDIALLDIRMPELNGVEAIKEITNKTNTKCLILTTFDEDEYVNEAINYGARGYILKSSSPEQIANAVESVYNNNIVMNDEVLAKINKQATSKDITKFDFTEREKEVIVAISEGLNNKEISNKLFISEGTVRNYITSILDKTNLEHRTAIAVNYLKGNL
ncbi:response regulator transcription factor [Clostridium sp. MSJ-8]|uniref:response regulator transcription factor n=1 Tax=Clostridium sp. MSJ-8 TaxID=2841510 RepID=UPI001C0F369C|nr:response regulator transcription factor [Clostridium sp. MSJ-8]MBU5487431.1 response regulator transcription factor [Clostridium sp. MSJ-8]